MDFDWIDLDEDAAARGQCYLPNEPSSQFLHAHIHAFLEYAQRVKTSRHDALTDNDRAAVLRVLQVGSDAFYDPYFSNTLFPLIVEYCAFDYGIETVEPDIPLWAEQTLKRSHLGLYRMEQGEQTLTATDVLSDVAIPLHASALNIPIAAGDTIAARIFSTPHVNVAISPFVLPRDRFDAVATSFRETYDASNLSPHRFAKTIGASSLLHALVDHAARLFAFERDLEIPTDQIERLFAAWTGMCDLLPNAQATFDGIASDGSLYRLIHQPNATLRLYRFRDPAARSAILRGGSIGGSRGLTMLGWTSSHATTYARDVSALSRIVGCCSLGRDFTKKEIVERDVEQNLSTIYWVTQSLRNRTFTRAA